MTGDDPTLPSPPDLGGSSPGADGAWTDTQRVVVGVIVGVIAVVVLVLVVFVFSGPDEQTPTPVTAPSVTAPTSSSTLGAVTPAR
jgi:hypothetical protein